MTDTSSTLNVLTAIQYAIVLIVVTGLWQLGRLFRIWYLAQCAVDVTGTEALLYKNIYPFGLRMAETMRLDFSNYSSNPADLQSLELIRLAEISYRTNPTSDHASNLVDAVLGKFFRDRANLRRSYSSFMLLGIFGTVVGLSVAVTQLSSSGTLKTADDIGPFLANSSLVLGSFTKVFYSTLAGVVATLFLLLFDSIVSKALLSLSEKLNSFFSLALFPTIVDCLRREVPEVAIEHLATSLEVATSAWPMAQQAFSETATAIHNSTDSLERSVLYLQETVQQANEGVHQLIQASDSVGRSAAESNILNEEFKQEHTRMIDEGEKFHAELSKIFQDVRGSITTQESLSVKNDTNLERLGNLVHGVSGTISELSSKLTVISDIYVQLDQAIQKLSLALDSLDSLPIIFQSFDSHEASLRIDMNTVKDAMVNSAETFNRIVAGANSQVYGVKSLADALTSSLVKAEEKSRTDQNLFLGRIETAIDSLSNKLQQGIESQSNLARTNAASQSKALADEILKLSGAIAKLMQQIDQLNNANIPLKSSPAREAPVLAPAQSQANVEIISELRRQTQALERLLQSIPRTYNSRGEAPASQPVNPRPFQSAANPGAEPPVPSPTYSSRAEAKNVRGFSTWFKRNK